MTEPRNINEARTLANIAQRAKTLFSDGYEYWHIGGAVFHVWDDTLGVFDAPNYEVNIEAKTCRCSEGANPSYPCPSMAKYRTCKHYLAVLETKEAEDWERDNELCQQWEAEQWGELVMTEAAIEASLR